MASNKIQLPPIWPFTKKSFKSITIHILEEIELYNSYIHFFGGDDDGGGGVNIIIGKRKAKHYVRMCFDNCQTIDQ